MSFEMLVKKVEEQYLKVACVDEDLFGGTLLDIMGDNFIMPLDLLKEVIVASQIISIANPRIIRQIVRYSGELQRIQDKAH